VVARSVYGHLAGAMPPKRSSFGSQLAIDMAVGTTELEARAVRAPCDFSHTLNRRYNSLILHPDRVCGSWQSVSRIARFPSGQVLLSASDRVLPKPERRASLALRHTLGRARRGSHHVALARQGSAE
jgi:hypothetical protein